MENIVFTRPDGSQVLITHFEDEGYWTMAERPEQGAIWGPPIDRDPPDVYEVLKCPECGSHFPESGSDGLVVHIIEYHPGSDGWKTIRDALEKR